VSGTLWTLHQVGSVVDAHLFIRDPDRNVIELYERRGV
jgi:hypothetical protein